MWNIQITGIESEAIIHTSPALWNPRHSPSPGQRVTPLSWDLGGGSCVTQPAPLLTLKESTRTSEWLPLFLSPALDKRRQGRKHRSPTFCLSGHSVAELVMKALPVCFGTFELQYTKLLEISVRIYLVWEDDRPRFSDNYKFCWLLDLLWSNGGWFSFLYNLLLFKMYLLGEKKKLFSIGSLHICLQCSQYRQAWGLEI